MAAGPSPSPSGSSRRCLSELLDQQQEPFSLDLFLLERGCSPALRDAVVCGGSGAACSACWPWPRSRMPVQPAENKKACCGSGVLRLLLCKLLRGKITPAPTAKKKQLRLPAVDRRHVDANDGEKRRMPGDFENSVRPRRAAETRTEKAEEEEVEDDDSKKRLSPVSVLEQRTLEQSPPAHEQKALLIFRKFLQAAYSPALLDLVAHAKDCSRNNKSKDSSTKTSPAAARRSRAHWEEEEKGVFEEAIAEATEVIASELAGGARALRAAWPGDVQVQPERRDVGVDIATAVLDKLVEETATELLMGMDCHDFAVDTARQHCWVSGR